MDNKFRFGAFLLSLLLISSFTFAQTSAAYKIRVGDIEVYSLSDGTVDIDAEKLFKNNEPGRSTKILEEQFMTNPVEVCINVFLLKIGSKIILIDSGAGELLGTSAGHLTKSLKSIGITPNDITDILLTHIHGDHSGGLVVKGEKVFPNAIIHVNKKEIDFWLDKENVTKTSLDKMGANPQTFENAEKMIKPYMTDGQVLVFNETGIEVLPHIYTYSIGGHTPGHTIYVLKNKSEELFFWGDIVHIGAIQLVDPNIPDDFDVDSLLSGIARNTFLKKAVDGKFLIAAAHVSFPGFGRLKYEKSKYMWYAIPYSISGRTH